MCTPIKILWAPIFILKAILHKFSVIIIYRGDDLMVPFRESKLTRLFQNYFVGKGGKEARQGKVTMFVNISNIASVFDETMHVLRFSALTSKVSLSTASVHRLVDYMYCTCYGPPAPHT